MIFRTARDAAKWAALAAVTLLTAACGNEGRFGDLGQAARLLGYGPAVLHNALVGNVTGSVAFSLVALAPQASVAERIAQEPAQTSVTAIEARHFKAYNSYLAYLARASGGEERTTTQVPALHCDPRSLDEALRY